MHDIEFEVGDIVTATLFTLPMSETCSTFLGRAFFFQGERSIGTDLKFHVKWL
jgi:hypothetical protein